MLFIKSLFSLFFVFALAARALLPAATSTQELNYTFSVVVPGSSTSTGMSQTINQFNPALGTLNSIDVTYNVIMRSGFIILPIGTPSGIYDFAGSYTTFLRAPSDTLGQIFGETPIISVSATAAAGGFTEFFNFPLLSYFSTFNNSSTLSQFTGAGTINLLNFGIFSFTNLTNIDVPPQFFSMVVDTGTTINFNYTPATAVPEPGTWLLLGTTLTLALLLKKRNAFAR